MRHLEDNIQTACVKWFDYQYPQFRLLLHHSPNGGKRNAREAARFKGMGTRAGFPDLIFLLPTYKYNGLFIEFKSEKGRQSEAQKEYELIACQIYFDYIVCRTFDEFKNIITDYIEHYEKT